MARDRNPDADLRVGDMHALPWDDGAFDVVTSFRGIWGTTPEAMAEVCRVLVPGGRVGLTVWGHIKASPGAWALAPFSLAAAPKVENQAAMVALGRPGAGETFLQNAGFTDVERIDIPFVFEFADPDLYARALASTGPAFEAMEAVGEAAFLQAAADLARERSAPVFPFGRPSRLSATSPGSRPDRSPSATILRVSNPTSQATSFLAAPKHTPEVQHLFDDDRKGRRLRDERFTPVGVHADCARRPVRSHGPGDSGRRPHPSAAGRSRDGRRINSWVTPIARWHGARGSRRRRGRRLRRRSFGAPTTSLDPS